MTQVPSPHVRRVLIIEDEFLIALDLEETMFKLGFDVCGLYTRAGKDSSLAISDQPYVPLDTIRMDEARVATSKAPVASRSV
jgi:hypothetical protein